MFLHRNIPMVLLSPPLLNLLARRFAALGHPVRLQIAHHLLEHGEANVGELAEVVGLAQPSISKHLSTLAEAHLIRGRREGSRVLYHVEDPSLASICELCCARMRDEIEALHSAVQEG
jgi:DNA-binding transcriptional ArsR family regulator